MCVLFSEAPLTGVLGVNGLELHSSPSLVKSATMGRWNATVTPVVSN